MIARDALRMARALKAVVGPEFAMPGALADWETHDGRPIGRVLVPGVRAARRVLAREAPLPSADTLEAIRDRARQAERGEGLDPATAERLGSDVMGLLQALGAA